MSNLLIKPDKCPECGKYAVYHGMRGRLGSEWIGDRCSECGYDKKDEIETAKMIRDTRKFKELYKKGLVELFEH